MATIKLLVVDDHEIVREGLRALFRRTGDIEVIGEAESVATAVSEAIRLEPDVVLMDMRLPDGTGVDACREIRTVHPNVRIMFLTSYDDQEATLSAALAGAEGYLLKEIDQNSLLKAIRSVAAGNPILDPAATRALLERVQDLANASEPAEGMSLSPQENRVMSLVVEGKTNREIAQTLDLSPKTVKNYLSNIFQKLHVTRRAQAAVLFSKRASS